MADTTISMTPTEFSSLEVGQKVVLSKVITAEAVEAFAQVSGDRNPLHMDDSFAASTPFGRRVVHGVLLASYVSTLVGVHLPGTGSLWTQQTFRWKLPVFIGDRIDITLTVTHKSEGTRTVAVEVEAVNQEGKVVMDGNGAVMLPEMKKKAETSPDAKVALIDCGTDGGGSVGMAVAAALAKAGLKIAVVARGNAYGADVVKRAVEREGGMAALVSAADIAPTFDGTQLAANIVINIASEGGNAVEGGAWASIDAALQNDLRCAVETASAALPVMTAQKWGVIINVGSTAASGPASPAQQAAAIANAALRAYTKTLAAQVGPQGIRVNMITPGPADFTGGGDRQKKVQAMQTPLRRLVSPEEIADVVVFLASDAARFVTGSDVPVSGGMTTL